jgi:hypothetical protein
VKASTLICAFVLTGLSGNGKSIDLFYQVSTGIVGCCFLQCVSGEDFDSSVDSVVKIWYLWAMICYSVIL